MDRRTFIKTGAAAVAAGAVTRAGATVLGQRRPNLVLIMADDMGFADLGCYGSEIATPNLDRLAAGGSRLMQFYNCARCCPTRASLLTGLYPHQAGVGHMVGPAFDHGSPGYQGHLAFNTATIAETLQPAGYRTLMAGKWHVGQGQGQLPVDRGFDRFLGIPVGAANYWKPKLYSGNQPIDNPPDCYTTDVFTDAALGFMKETRADRKPYFLYLAFNAPHWPLHARPEDIEKYMGRYDGGWDQLRNERHERQKALGVVDPKWPLSPRDPAAVDWAGLSPDQKKRMSKKMAVYAAMVDRLDQNVGRVMRDIEAAGELDNTLIVFLSDNGACHETGPLGFESHPKYLVNASTAYADIGTAESFCSYGRSWSNAGNTPFRLHKHWTHEGGISSPLIAHWPERLSARQVSGPGHVIDLMPTLLDAAGAAPLSERDGRPVQMIEGRSLLPQLAGGSASERALGWEHEGNRAWRQGDLKLVSAFDAGNQWELYNVVEDRTEQNNLAAKLPDKVVAMSRAWEAWGRRVGVEPWKKSQGVVPWIKEFLNPRGGGGRD